MSPLTAAVVLAWVVLLLLGLGLAGCLRLIHLLSGRLDEAATSARRITVGDLVTLPLEAAAAIGSDRTSVLLFARQGCGACARAEHVLGDALRASGRPPLVVLHRDPVPVQDTPVGHLYGQEEAFDELRVGLVPFVVVLEGRRVVARAAVGDPSRLSEMVAVLDGLPADEGTAAAGRRPLPGDAPFEMTSHPANRN